MAIITRHGNEADFDPNRMRTAEFASFDDSGKIMHTQRPGVVRQLMTVQDAEAMIDEKIEPAVTRAEAAAESAEASAELANSSEVNAGASAEEAETNAGLSQSYAVGTGGVVREGDDTDNAKYYYEQARAIVDVEIATTEKAGIVKPDGVTISVEADGTIHSVVEGGVTGVKGASETEYRSGNVNITAENVGAYTTNAVDLSKAELQVLGWTVPSQLAVKNYIGTDGKFHKKVGRKPAWELGAWIYESANNQFRSAMLDFWKVPTSGFNTNVYSNAISSSPTESIRLRGINANKGLYIADTVHTDVASFVAYLRSTNAYIYYELATEEVLELDGQEAGYFAKKNVTTNLLKPTLQSTTLNGITITVNTDGTIKLHGTTATPNWSVNVCTVNFKANEMIRLVGWKPSESGYMYIGGLNKIDYGSGVNFVGDENSHTVNISIPTQGTTLNNVIIKPMLTTDLNATYDDFIPYTGDTGTLNGDVANLSNRFETITLPANGSYSFKLNPFDAVILIVSRSSMSYSDAYILPAGGIFKMGSSTAVTVTVNQFDYNIQNNFDVELRMHLLKISS